MIFLIGLPLVAQLVKSLPLMQETRLQSLGWEDPLEKEMATHSGTLAWRIPWTEDFRTWTDWFPLGWTGWLLYNIGLISVIHQQGLTIGVHMSPPSKISLPPPADSRLSRLFQSPSLSSLSHSGTHSVSAACCSLHLSHLLPLLPHPCPQSVLCVCVSAATLWTDSSVPSFYIPDICINIWCLLFSFSLTSLCIIGSRFIHLIRTNSNACLFMAE